MNPHAPISQTRATGDRPGGPTCDLMGLLEGGAPGNAR